MFKEIASVEVVVTETKIKKTFEYFVNGKRKEYSLIAPIELWEDEYNAKNIVEAQIKAAQQSVQRTG